MPTDRDSFVLLIHNLEATSKVNGEVVAAIIAIREKCDKAFLPFAESEIQFIDPVHPTEESEHIVALHREAFTLRHQCDSVLGSKLLESSEITSAAPKIRDNFLECCARIENIFIQRRPELLPAVDAVL